MSNKLLNLVWGVDRFGPGRTGPVRRLVMATLACRVNDSDGDLCYPGLVDIADRTELGESTVKRTLADLIAAGWLTKETRPGYGSAYRLQVARLENAQRPKLERKRSTRISRPGISQLHTGQLHTGQPASESLAGPSDGLSWPVNDLHIRMNQRESQENHKGAFAPVVSPSPERAKLVVMPGKSTEEWVAEIWALWPVKQSKQKGVAAIRKALAHLTQRGSGDAGAELKVRVQAWLAWHAREKAKMQEDPRNYFVAAIGYAEGWFGDRQRRYLDDNAEPKPEPRIMLPSGAVVPQSAALEDGWEIVRAIS